MPRDERVLASDLGEGYSLITDSEEIQHVLECIGKESEYGEYGCLFVSVGEGEYLEVYGAGRSIPRAHEPLDRLL